MIGYRLEYKAYGSDEWAIYKPLERNRSCGVVFDTLKYFPDETSYEVVKRWFWKTYKIDIDRLPDWQRLVKLEDGDA